MIALDPFPVGTLVHSCLATLPIPIEGREALRGLFFPERATRDHFLPYKETRLAEAPFGPVGDDNGPGLEPPPHIRKRYVSTFTTSRRWPPAALGKPSFSRFK
ncbi:hypothetical protein THAOC_24811, partial [Thalassiosira oceanica]